LAGSRIEGKAFALNIDEDASRSLQVGKLATQPPILICQAFH
jgi:hypothetical protein